MQTQEPVLETPDNVEPVAPTWHTLLLPWWRAVVAVLPVFLFTRLLFVLLGYFGGVLFTTANFSPTPVSYHNLLAGWNQGDEASYIALATDGYTKAQQVLFFPLYPTLMRLFAPLLRHSMLASGFFLSNSAFLGALIVAYRLVEDEFDRDTAKRTVLYLAIFPTAFFFFVAYSESLFLLLALLSVYAVRRGAWWLAGLFGALATLTRFEGVFLFVVFGYEFVRQMTPSIRQAWGEKSLLKRFVPASYGLAGLLILLGLFVYISALNSLFHDPFAVFHAQQGAGLAAPWVGPLRAVNTLFRQPRTSFAAVHTLLDFIALALFIMLLVLCFFGPERFARSQWVLALFGTLLLFYALLFPASPMAHGGAYDPLASMQRLVLSIFPAFILLGRLGRRAWFHQGYLLLALPLLAFFVLQFITGHWTV